MYEERTTNKALVAVIVVVLLAAAAAGALYLTNKNDQSSDVSQQAPVEDTTPSQNIADSSETQATSTYKVGTYTASGSYTSPGGRETIDVSITLDAGGVITASKTTSDADNATSRQYQSEFINNYKDLVVGKKIDDVQLSRVAGSSLTSGGFNDALEQIKQDAAA